MYAESLVHAEFSSKGFPNERLCFCSCWVHFKRVPQWIPVHIFMLSSVQKGFSVNTYALVHAEFSSERFPNEYVCTCSCWVTSKGFPSEYLCTCSCWIQFRRVPQQILVHLFMLSPAQRGFPNEYLCTCSCWVQFRRVFQWTPVHLFMLSSVQRGSPTNTCALLLANQMWRYKPTILTTKGMANLKWLMGKVWTEDVINLIFS